MEPGNTLSLPVTGTLFCSRGTANCQDTTTASDSAARAKATHCALRGRSCKKMKPSATLMRGRMK